MAKKYTPFELAKAIPAAWDLLWARNLKTRAEGNDWKGSTSYLCASDVESQVRAMAQDSVDGVPWGTTQPWGTYYSGIRIRCPGPGGLQGAVRDWLLNNPNLTAHNFMRGHISGMRFRPVGEPLNAAEAKTIAAKAECRANPKPSPVHYSHNGHYGLAKCVWARKQKRASAFGRSYSSGRSRAHTVSDVYKVTCKQCLNLIAKDLKETA